jgi:membrane protein YdbS with pleckstrin-like domain
MLFSPYYFGEPLFYMDWKPILDKSDNIYVSVKIDHEPRKLFFSNLKDLLLQVVFIVILIVAIWVIFINLYGALKVNTEIAISIAIIVALGLVVGINKLFLMWRKRRIQRKISSDQ